MQWQLTQNMLYLLNCSENDNRQDANSKNHKLCHIPINIKQVIITTF